ncbi:MAG: SprB repeat-containing protein [Bacteroidetes bacterium]|nr:SprB repeat-containing protein [Bacteroidota bacterium]
MKKQLFILLFSSITFLGFSTGHVVNTFVINNTTCGNPNGSVRATVSGGVGPFTYSWNTNPVQNNDTAFAVMAGSYTVTVTDQNDMSTSTGVITVTNTFNPITVIANGQSVICEGGMATIVANATGVQVLGYTGQDLMVLHLTFKILFLMLG